MQNICDICGSKKLTITPEGFTVCIKCGTEQNIPNIYREKYGRNEMGTAYFYTIGGNTRMGNTPGRPGFVKYAHLRKIQKIMLTDHKNRIMKDAYNEIRRICSQLNLQTGIIPNIMEKFTELWKQFDLNRSEKKIETLIPIIIYRMTAEREIRVDMDELFGVMKCSVRDFRKMLFKYGHYFTNKKGNITKIKSIVTMICSLMRIPHRVTERALKLVKNNKHIMTSTTPGVGAAAAVSLAVISFGLRKEFPPAKIAATAGASPSAVGNRISKLLTARGLGSSMGIKKAERLIIRQFDKLMGSPTIAA